MVMSRNLSKERKFEDNEVQRDIKLVLYEIMNKDGKPYIRVKIKDGEIKKKHDKDARKFNGALGKIKRECEHAKRALVARH
ncbi:unnamed protein product [Dovyalis caffra]|uniref:Uncharacterized protein n=1 Tax=Dovyalis caffra TaxID=77055 RepID=A0AAV1STL6_9ROSI|nr:unnamed protein product [Dovyalis caffra]